MTTEHPDRAAPFGEIAGVVLAGGRSQRMGGGNKALLTLGGQPLLARIVERAAPQVAALVVNANGDPADVSAYGLPVVSDGVSGFVGPLAGVLSGMEWAAARGGYRWVASFAADTPFFPVDLVARLAAAATERSESVV